MPRPGIALNTVLGASGSGMGASRNGMATAARAGGAWSFAEMADWQRSAGLRSRRPIRLVTGPGGGLQVAEKPRR
jgi:hypothetical protein